MLYGGPVRHKGAEEGGGASRAELQDVEVRGEEGADDLHPRPVDPYRGPVLESVVPAQGLVVRRHAGPVGGLILSLRASAIKCLENIFF